MNSAHNNNGAVRAHTYVCFDANAAKTEGNVANNPRWNSFLS